MRSLANETADVVGSGWIWSGAALALAALSMTGQTGEPAKPAVVVKIHEENPIVVEGEQQPADPVQRIHFQSQGPMVTIIDEMKRNLHLSHFPTFLLDGQMLNPNAGMIRFELENGQLPKTPSGRERIGTMSIYNIGTLRITRLAEVVPTKAPGPMQKRRLDSVLIRYLVENKDTQTHKVGVRAYLDAYIIDNDGAQFAAPTHPGKILDGIELKDKTLPDYVQVLQRPDLKNSGFVAHLTLNLGSGFDKADRVVLTRHGMGFGTWQMTPVPSMGDSAFGVFWEPKEIKPGGKREIAYAYGQGIAVAPENEGRFEVTLGGSFEPGKHFTVAATIPEPATGQSLTLELPPGMERIEGKETQPLLSEQGPGLVLWKASVLRPGDYRLSIRSSTGLTRTKVISISTK